MSEELKKLKEAMTAVGGHLQDLQHEQSATTRELNTVVTVVDDLQTSVRNLQTSVRNLQARSVQMEAATVALGGTFASIEQILTTLLADHERVDTLEQQNVTLLRTVSDLTRRVEALEKRAS